MKQALCVWVDDSHAIVRRGLVACLITADVNVLGESVGFVPAPRVGGKDVLVFETAPGMLRRAVAVAQGTGVHLVAVENEPTDKTVCQLVEAGVQAVLPLPHLTPESLLRGVRAVAHGQTMLPSDLVPGLLAHVRASGMSMTGALTEREREVLRWLADGSDTLEIAAGMCFSERTVKNVVHDILTKLNCRTRAHAVALATRSGVI